MELKNRSILLPLFFAINLWFEPAFLFYDVLCDVWLNNGNINIDWQDFSNHIFQEKKRLIEEEKRKLELKERERAIHAIVNKHNMSTQGYTATSAVSSLPKPNLNSTQPVEQPVNSQEKMPNPDS